MPASSLAELALALDSIKIVGNCRVRGCSLEAFEEGWCKAHFLQQDCHEPDQKAEIKGVYPISWAMAVCKLCGREYDIDMDQLAKCPVNIRRSLVLAKVVPF